MGCDSIAPCVHRESSKYWMPMETFYLITASAFLGLAIAVSFTGVKHHRLAKRYIRDLAPNYYLAVKTVIPVVEQMHLLNEDLKFKAPELLEHYEINETALDEAREKLALGLASLERILTVYEIPIPEDHVVDSNGRQDDEW